MADFVPLSRVREILHRVAPSVNVAKGVKANDALTHFRTMNNQQRANVARVVIHEVLHDHYAEQARK